MGEEGNGVTREIEVVGPSPARVPDDDPQMIEHAVETTRAELADLHAELDRRRHEAFDLRLQLRRHRTALAVVALAAVGVLASSWAYRRSHRDGPLDRVQNLAHALALVAREPDNLVRAMENRRTPMSPGNAIVAALAKIAGAAGQRAVARAI